MLSRLTHHLYCITFEWLLELESDCTMTSDNTEGTEQSAHSMLQDYADVFESINQFTGEHTTRLTGNARPKVYLPCRVPIEMQETF